MCWAVQVRVGSPKKGGGTPPPSVFVRCLFGNIPETSYNVHYALSRLRCVLAQKTPARTRTRTRAILTGHRNYARPTQTPPRPNMEPEPGSGSRAPTFVPLRVPSPNKKRPRSRKAPEPFPTCCRSRRLFDPDDFAEWHLGRPTSGIDPQNRIVGGNFWEAPAKVG